MPLRGTLNLFLVDNLLALTIKRVLILRDVSSGRVDPGSTTHELLRAFVEYANASLWTTQVWYFGMLAFRCVAGAGVYVYHLIQIHLYGYVRI